MSLALIGVFVGLAFAVAEYVVFGLLLARVRARGENGRGPRILDVVRKAQVIVFPLVGWFIGRFLAGQSGVS